MVQPVMLARPTRFSHRLTAASGMPSVGATEGVYVGYRYFDSFYTSIKPRDPASVVNYPFGYGMSYTKFAIDTQSVRADMDEVTVKTRVTNTGKVPGKEVVQVYFSAPRGGLDKPYQELAGYAKTDLLAPGASHAFTLPTEWGGRFWGRTGCVFDADGAGSCETADCGKAKCGGAGGKPPATLAEFQLAGFGGKDFYDISLVDGYNLPMSVTPVAGHGCRRCPVADAREPAPVARADRP